MRLKLVSNKIQSMSALLMSVKGRRLLEDSKILQSSAPTTEVPNVVNVRFDSSVAVAIVFAAFFLSMLCAVGINALFHCRLCRRWRVVSEPSHDVGLQRAEIGIKKFDLKALPVSLYSTGLLFAGLDCSICLAEFMEGERVRVLPECSHSFHADCIDAWLISNPSCPSCRHSLLFILSKKPSGIARPEESVRMDVTQRNESVVASHIVQSFHTSSDDSTMTASSSLDSIQSSDLEYGNKVER